MPNEPLLMDFDQFAGNLREVFERVRDRNQPVRVERDGEIYRLEREQPHDIWQRYDPEKVRQALKASAGALKGVDRNELLEDIYAQREQGGTYRPK